MNGESKFRNRGFASMDKELQRQIASKGGKSVSRNREYMAKIGAIGGSKKRNKDKGDELPTSAQ